jgi:outer membrane receptor for ferric coprogen and ferric-rhodotorulic acid
LFYRSDHNQGHHKIHSVLSHKNPSLGSWNSWSSSADISAPLNADGSLRGRMFVKHSDYLFYRSDHNQGHHKIHSVLSHKNP